MTNLVQEIIHQAEYGRMLSDREVSRFTPAEIREAIQALVADQKDELACALGDAGLSLYPQSEDMLAITGLLAMMRQDWHMAVELLEDLMKLQGEKAPAFTYVMFVRALRCNLDPARALQVAKEGLRLYPEQVELLTETLILDDYSESMTTHNSAH